MEIDKDRLIEELKRELERARERARDLEETRTAMLYMLEDLNESTERLEQAKKDWELTFDNISDPIIMHDRNFKIIRANRAYRKHAGMDYISLLGMPYYKIFPRLNGPSEACLKALDTGREEEEEITINDKVFKVRYYPIYDSDGKFLHSFHIMEDITEEKRAEEQIRLERDISSSLLELTEATARTTNMDALMKQAVDNVRKITGCNACLFYLWDHEYKIFRPGNSSGLSHELNAIFRTEPLDINALGELGFHRHEPLELRTINVDKRVPSHLTCLSECRSLAFIPLRGRRMVLGLIIQAYKKHKIFEERDYIIMKGISNQVSIAIEEANLYKESIEKTMELSRKIETIQVMHEIDRSVLSTLDRREILNTAIRMVRKVVINCDASAIVLSNKDHGCFQYEAGFGLDSLKKHSFLKREGEDICSVIENGRLNYVPDLKDPMARCHLRNIMLREGLNSCICYPVIIKGEGIGVLIIASKRPSAFSPDDISTIENISAQISVALENSRLFTDLRELFIGTISALSEAIDAKSPWTRGHSDRVTEYVLIIGKAMGMDEEELEDLRIAGLLHDIGKIGTYDVLLDKPGRLTDEEYKIVKAHPEHSARLLTPIKQLRHIIPWIKHHHERWDGRGYPDGLKGEAIPLQSRILSVADTFDSMTAERPYRKTPGKERTIEELKRCAGTQFDPRVVEVFIKELERQQTTDNRPQTNP
jgi:PAS domain S-box-containing protein